MMYLHVFVAAVLHVLYNTLEVTDKCGPKYIRCISIATYHNIICSSYEGILLLLETDK